MGTLEDHSVPQEIILPYGKLPMWGQVGELSLYIVLLFPPNRATVVAAPVGKLLEVPTLGVQAPSNCLASHAMLKAGWVLPGLPAARNSPPPPGRQLASLCRVWPSLWPHHKMEAFQWHRGCTQEDSPNSCPHPGRALDVGSAGGTV